MTGIPDNPVIQKLISTLLLGLVLWCATSAAPAADLPRFCERLPRPAYAAFEKHAASNDWFEVYEIAPGIFALYEPYQWQQVISYLILGQDMALLFDTGNGIGNIKAVVDQLTDKPVTVLNSHTHFDHIGGNFQFDKVVSVSTPFSIANSHGLDNDMVKTEVSAQALCKDLPEGVIRASHRIKPFTITNTVKEGDVIDLGNRKLEVLQVPRTYRRCDCLAGPQGRVSVDRRHLLRRAHLVVFPGNGPGCLP